MLVRRIYRTRRSWRWWCSEDFCLRNSPSAILATSLHLFTQALMRRSQVLISADCVFDASLVPGTCLHRFVDLKGFSQQVPGESGYRTLRPLVRFPLSPQPVDATPSNELIRHYFPWGTDLFGFTRSKPSQGSVPADLIQRAILAFVFKCCVDP